MTHAYPLTLQLDRLTDRRRPATAKRHRAVAAAGVATGAALSAGAVWASLAADAPPDVRIRSTLTVRSAPARGTQVIGMVPSP